jgi:hypothetical protein
MSQDIVPSKDNNKICEAVNCSAQAIKEIKVKVGNMGSITLSLCEDCQSKFLQKEVQLIE